MTGKMKKPITRCPTNPSNTQLVDIFLRLYDSSKSTNRRGESCAQPYYTLTWPILLDPGHGLHGHSEAMGTTKNPLTDSGEDSERGADNGTRGSAEMMRIYPLHAFETAAPARIRRLKWTLNM